MACSLPHIPVGKLVFVFILFTSTRLSAQITPESAPDTVGPMPSYEERAKKWGPNDTIVTDAVWYNREMLSYKEEPMVWVSKLSGKKLDKYMEEWSRLRAAVYVTYPFARTAGATINDINTHLSGETSKKKRKEYIKTREKELRSQFTEPLSNLSVYQGKILMKLINRQTGNNCFEIIKEYKGSMNARLYQTVAFFFGSNLKQDWDPTDKTDRQIENFVKEIDGMWYNNPYRK
ncbi:MAG TPA: DUF4294 domain-containing protein [Chitinophagaceae bacterium]|nr:DUF4294 domain-containing protein [Chitinophagaceae bacterium]